ASTTCAITSLALHSPTAGASANRAGGTATAAVRSRPIASRTFSTIADGGSLAPCASRYPRIRFCSSVMVVMTSLYRCAYPAHKSGILHARRLGLTAPARRRSIGPLSRQSGSRAAVWGARDLRDPHSVEGVER